MSLVQLYAVVLVGGLTVLASIAAARAAVRLGFPALLAFLALGVLLGEDVLGIKFDDATLAQNLGMVALALILVDGGLTTQWRDIRSLLLPAAMLATLGVAVSAGVVAAGAHLLLGLDWRTSLLLGAIVSSTDAAATFSVLRHLPLPPRIAGMLEAESGFNDAPTVIAVLILSGAAHVPATPGWIVADMVYELAIGAAVGLGIGWLGSLAARHVALPVSGLYPLATLGLGMVSFAAAGAASASGFISAYLTGVVLGNSTLPHGAATRSFADGAAWLAQIGLFVMLGLLVTPSQLPSAVVPALVVGAVMLLAARPLSVAASLTPFRIPWREQALVSWAGMRGAVPIVLATIPVVAALPGSGQVLNIVFVLVVAFTLVQGPSLAPVAKLLGLTRPDQPRDVDIDAAPLDVLDAALLTVTVPPKSKLHGLYMYELRLPSHSVVNSVIRDGELFVPKATDRLRSGDELLIVTLRGEREATEARLRALGRAGKLAKWFKDDGEPDPD
ncbi:MAG: potassium/proton antiporter [Stackebrandtia sp.]